MSLENVRIAKICPASWAEMHGDDKVRHCSKCSQRVFNLSSMTSEEAEMLIASRDGRMCLRFYRRDDGKVMTKDCPVGVARSRRSAIVMTGTLLTFLLSVASAAGMSLDDLWPKSKPEFELVQGKMADPSDEPLLSKPEGRGQADAG